jgi:hypothetical protein
VIPEKKKKKEKCVLFPLDSLKCVTVEVGNLTKTTEEEKEDLVV